MSETDAVNNSQSPSNETHDSNNSKDDEKEMESSVVSTETQPVNETSKPKSSKVEVLLKAAGDAPIIKKKKWALEPNKKIGFIVDFIKKLIKCDAQDSLFLYVDQSFAPAPDIEVGTLYECFGADGKLILHYCKTQAWG